MIRLITFGNTKVWLFIQQLHRHTDREKENLLPVDKYLCYFKFSEPTVISLGEIIQDPNTNSPFVFSSPDKAEEYAISLLDKQFN
jgi:hypothetical protein